MSDILEVEPRSALGKLNNRRLRRAGSVPAVLYGHGGACVNLAIPTDEFVNAVQHGSKMFDLKGAVNESALISEIQWDTFGREVLHVDLVRVSKDERLEVSVPLETRGVAPGVRVAGLSSLKCRCCSKPAVRSVATRSSPYRHRRSFRRSGFSAGPA